MRRRLALCCTLHSVMRKDQIWLIVLRTVSLKEVPVMIHLFVCVSSPAFMLAQRRHVLTSSWYHDVLPIGLVPSFVALDLQLLSICSFLSSYGDNCSVLVCLLICRFTTGLGCTVIFFSVKIRKLSLLASQHSVCSNPNAYVQLRKSRLRLYLVLSCFLCPLFSLSTEFLLCVGLLCFSQAQSLSVFVTVSDLASSSILPVGSF